MWRRLMRRYRRDEKGAARCVGYGMARDGSGGDRSSMPVRSTYSVNTASSGSCWIATVTRRIPLTTDDLTRLIEQDADDLDLFADLSLYGNDNVVVEGVTTFVPGRRPRIQIARQLSENARQEARLRTTLAHELGHVLLHDFTGKREDVPRPWQADDPDTESTTRCTPWAIGTGSRVDWMEWQANYASGALLMPRTAVWQAVHSFVEDEGNTAPYSRACLGPMVDWMQGHFLVSEAAAYVRLRQLRYLPGTGSLLVSPFDTRG